MIYKVTLKNGSQTKEIHNDKQKLRTGIVKRGINTIDSFSFTISPNNAGFKSINDFTTLVEVYNTKRKIYEFQGRVLYSNDNMEESGLISKSVVCESYFGFLHDSVQDYVVEKNWTVTELLTHIITIHNSQVEDYKHFEIGTITATDPNDNLYLGIQRESSWKTIQDKLINNIGGELRFRVVDGVTYIDYLESIGTTKTTEIKLGKNMKSISKENDPSSYITRLIPLGAKLLDEEGNETEERVDITIVNDGKNYIDDEIAIAKYGLHIKYETWDGVFEPLILKTKATNFLTNNNKVLQKYSITNVDLALIGLDTDYFDVGNKYPVKNKLLGIDDTLRVISKDIDVVTPTSSKIEVGDNFKSLSDIQLEKDNQLNESINTIKVIESNYVTKQAVTSTTNELYSYIDQKETSIKTTVSETYTSKSEFEDFQSTVETNFTQTNKSFEMTFTDIVSSITNLDGTVNEHHNELIRYIRFVGGSIVLGEVDNPLTLTLSNNRLSFQQNGVEVAYVSDNKLYIYDGEFLYSLKIGRWVYVPRSNGNLSFMYV